MNRRFASAAWFLLGYTVLVILWGAFVRATGAGAGCGNHWPLCNGEILPPSPRVETLIELGHRLTSGLLGLLVLGLVVAAFRVYPQGHAVRKGAVCTFFFIVTESLLGAGLVRTVDNFGGTGEAPSHPALLDWLTYRFVEEGWSLKWLVKEIVLSRTYGLASGGRAAKIDPENRLLSHANRKRLDAGRLVGAVGLANRRPERIGGRRRLAEDHRPRSGPGAALSAAAATARPGLCV